MDRLVAEKETITEEKIETKTAQQFEEKVETVVAQTEEVETENAKYLNSFENLTVADFIKQEKEKELKQFELEKEKLIQKQFEKKEEKKQEIVAEEKQSEPEKKEKQEVSQKIIEKPNYDLISENSKIVKLTRNEKPKKKTSKKKLSLILSLVLAVSAIICISNVVAIEHMSSNLASVEHELYDVNLPKYLKDIADLDTTKKGMEFIETYPDEKFDAGSAGHKSNWFDKLCNFLSGLFGG